MVQSPQPALPPRHLRLFELLRHANQGASTTRRLALPGHRVLEQAMAVDIQQRAIASLKAVAPAPRLAASPDGWHRAIHGMFWWRQKNALASSPMVMAPMTFPLAGSVTATET